MGLKEELESSSARTPALILAVLVLLGVGLAAVAALQGDGDPITSQVVRAAPRATTTTSSTVAVDASTTTTSPPAVGVPTVTSAPGTPVVPTVVPTTAGPVPVQTTAAPPATPPPTPQCTPEQADQTLTPDKAVYTDGEIVTVTATIRNHSASTCAIAEPASGCYSLFTAMAGANLDTFWRSGGGATGPCSPPPRRTLLPGQVATYSATWDQLDRRGCPPANCSGSPRVVGIYTIRSGWLGAPKTVVLTLQ